MITYSAGTLSPVTTAAVANTTPGTSSIVVNVGATLLLDNTGTNNVNRINDAQTPGLLNGGTLNFLANNNANTASSEVLGALALGAGASTVRTGYAGTPVTGTTSLVTFSALNQVPAGTVLLGATLNFVGNNANLGSSATNQVAFKRGSGSLTGSASVTGGVAGAGIIPFATVTSSTGVLDLASTLAAATGTITAFDRYYLATGTSGGVFTGTASGTQGAAATATDTIKVTASAAVGAATAANALLINNGGGTAVTISGANTLTLNSGTLVDASTAAGDNFSTAILNFATGVEGTIIDNTGSNLAISTAIPATSTDGLTISGGGTLTLNAANLYTGTTNLDSGILVVGNNAALGGRHPQPPTAACYPVHRGHYPGHHQPLARSRRSDQYGHRHGCKYVRGWPNSGYRGRRANRL